MAIDRNAGAASVNCPARCVMHGTPDHSVIWHVSESVLLTLPGSEPLRRTSMQVRAAQYLPDGATWEPAVELAHHVGDRYRVDHLTPVGARRVAELLLPAADHAEYGCS
ncbi:DUF6907 domain-containing protein [Geodermatophilus ruber]|uniref:Uncharacterized protein n=1 Tax=Geodermatophilus ruber TaxID=504800 RepID=A0A1I4GKE0_9ACTN|nr:hypothetical protein [Geodermatophilus ruber]SFL29943.1 hypothetical protein SAMN04488085_10931 [Geodermatophilus ruber]